MGNVGEREAKRDTRIGTPLSLPFSTMPSCRNKLGETNGLHPTMQPTAVQRPGPGDQMAAARSTTLLPARPGLGLERGEGNTTQAGRLPPLLGAEVSIAYCAAGAEQGPTPWMLSLGPRVSRK